MYSDTNTLSLWNDLSRSKRFAGKKNSVLYVERVLSNRRGDAMDRLQITSAAARSGVVIYSIMPGSEYWHVGY
jgi:hypothetical protein